MAFVLDNIWLIALGVLPSLAWLSFYFREDCHPEPKSLLAKTFLMGIIIAPLAIVFQLGFIKIFAFIFAPELSGPAAESAFSKSPEFFMWAAFVEEFVKFFAVSLVVFRNIEFDEPVDAMIYMITAALGFAAIENILILFQIIPNGTITAVSTLALRFVGATLLHALASAILGYFLAVSWFFQAHRKKLLIIGLILATAFHFSFNIMISSFDSPASSLLYTTSLLIFMAYLISVLFDRLRKRHTNSMANIINV
jgi:protease PrsW